jgi:hypothetical protein
MSPDWLIGFMSADMASVLDRHGMPLGTARIKTSWNMPHGGVQYQVESIIYGTRYTGRTAGGLWRGKRMKGVHYDE